MLTPVLCQVTGGRLTPYVYIIKPDRDGLNQLFMQISSGNPHLRILLNLRL